MALRTRLFLVLIILCSVVAVAVVGLIVGERYGTEWFPLLNVAVSASLSIALVILYFRQSSILQSQKKLLEAEMNRGVREQHTETLRERVRDWHGNPDRELGDNPLDQPDQNLPRVGRACFYSVSEDDWLFPEEAEFRVIPRRLKNDRYLKDLLENHAPDLEEQAEEIKALQEEFSTYRNQFQKNFDYKTEVRHNGLTFEPQEYLSQWIFEHLIRFERGYVDDFTELREKMIGGVDDARQYSPNQTMLISVDAAKIESRPIYEIKHDDENIDWRDMRPELVNQVEEIVWEILSKIESDAPNTTVRQAAETLDEGAAAVEELEQILIEYDGKPIYTGECEYLREARIDA